MKSTTCIRLLVSVASLAAATIPASACGPYFTTIPTPEFFKTGRCRQLAHFEREENLRLWQDITSPQIPLTDIENVVYKSSFDDELGLYSPRKADGKNLFLTYLFNTGDDEIVQYIYRAKEIEHCREQMQSPWHYPETRGYDNDAPTELNEAIKYCINYRGKRLKDRYAMLAVRSMFATNQYDRCIEYYDSVLSGYPDENLMKRMAGRYVAGAWSRLGDTGRADTLFARMGDIWSISDNKRLDLMCEFNPNAPQLMEWLRYNASDTTLMLRAAAEAEQLLRDNRVVNKGDWSFLCSYVNDTYGDNLTLARRYIRNAMSQQFSSDEMKELAQVWRMKTDAKAGVTSTLLADLKWLEEKLSPLNPDAKEWTKRLRNIIYSDVVLSLWRQRDYTTAIMLCAYADHIDVDMRRYCSDWFDKEYWHTDYYPIFSMLLSELRKNQRYDLPQDYSSLSFQLMGSLTSGQLASVYSNMQKSTPLYDFLRRKVRTDRDYYYETIGTLALREENYERAESYLSRVSDDYIRTMNVTKGGYLSRDLFDCYTSYRLPAQFMTGEGVGINPKLQYARMMKSLKADMLNGKTPDERGLARLRYAIAKKASYFHNWALTQYWRGSGTNLFWAYTSYWDDPDADPKLDFYETILYNFDISDDYTNYDKGYEQEIAEALAMLTTDEARAEAEYILGNLATVVARYPSTTTAAFIRSSCDNWKSWI